MVCYSTTAVSTEGHAHLQAPRRPGRSSPGGCWAWAPPWRRRWAVHRMWRAASQPGSSTSSRPGPSHDGECPEAGAGAKLCDFNRPINWNVGCAAHPVAIKLLCENRRRYQHAALCMPFLLGLCSCPVIAGASSLRCSCRGAGLDHPPHNGVLGIELGLPIPQGVQLRERAVRQFIIAVCKQ